MSSLIRDTHRLEEKELQNMSYEELLYLEDELLLANELNPNLRVRFITGRLVLFVLTALLWGIIFILMNLATMKMKNPLLPLIQFCSVIASLFLAGILSTKIWERIGIKLRMIMRYGLH